MNSSTLNLCNVVCHIEDGADRSQHPSGLDLRGQDGPQDEVAFSSSWNRRTTGTSPSSSTTKPSPSAYALSKRDGHEDTTRRFSGSSSKRMSATASGPATTSSAAISSRTVTVKPGRQTTRVCGRKAVEGTRRAMTRFWIVTSGLAIQTGRSSSGEVSELPMGQVAGRPWRGSRMMPVQDYESTWCGNFHSRRYHGEGDKDATHRR